jgi:hypothetical protein
MKEESGEVSPKLAQPEFRKAMTKGLIRDGAKDRVGYLA